MRILDARGVRIEPGQRVAHIGWEIRTGEVLNIKKLVRVAFRTTNKPERRSQMHSTTYVPGHRLLVLENEAAIERHEVWQEAVQDLADHGYQEAAELLDDIDPYRREIPRLPLAYRGESTEVRILPRDWYRIDRGPIQH